MRTSETRPLRINGKTYTPRSGWWVVNHAAGYLDLEKAVFNFFTPHGLEAFNEQDYIDLRVTFVECEEGQPFFLRSYITLHHNKPSGDHGGWDEQINVTIGEAVRLCLEELK